jgi:DeoR family transcriptional regulator, suf operon transcriptional repressor
MMPPSPQARTESDPTRAQLLALLRRGSTTVEELAGNLSLTNNAVRFHLAGLEADGTVARLGVKKGPGAGKPAAIYGLTAAAEEAFSRAYAPVLAACMVELRESMSRSQLLGFLKRVGRRIAGAAGSPRGSLAKRVTQASGVLNDLGGITTVEQSGSGYRIVGTACPLASVVKTESCVCAAVTALVAEVAGAEVRENCDRSGRPRCCFEISGGA